jgi:hypothetical protein
MNNKTITPPLGVIYIECDAESINDLKIDYLQYSRNKVSVMS